MTGSRWLLIDLALLIVARLPLAILAFLWAIYMGSTWTTIVVFVPWQVGTVELVPDRVSGS